MASIFIVTSCSGKDNQNANLENPEGPINPIDDPTPVHEHVFNKEVPSKENLATAATYHEPATYYFSRFLLVCL